MVWEAEWIVFPYRWQNWAIMMAEQERERRIGELRQLEEVGVFGSDQRSSSCTASG